MQATEKVDKYLLEELQLQPFAAEIVSKKVCKHDDILREFLHWLDTRSFDDVENPVTVNGYTAAKIHEVGPVLDGVGVYTFLVDLRDQPEQAMKYIEDGFEIR